MRISILAAGYPPDIRGGGEVSSQILAEALSRAGANVNVLCCASREEQFSNNGVTVRRVLSPNIYWSFQTPDNKLKQAIWHVRENYNPSANQLISNFIDETRPDLFLTSTIENFGAEAWRAPRQKDVKTVHILRSYYPFCRRATAFRGQHNCDKPCIDCNVGSLGRRQASQSVDGVIGLSHVILDRHIREGFFKNAARAVIPGTVYPLKKDFSAKKLGPVFVLGYLGFLTPNKGIELIADAIRLNPSLSGVEIRIAGTGEEAYVKMLKAHFSGLNVSFVGWKDSEDFLHEIDYLVVPSVFQEPFGRIVAEAFTSGVPVIGSRTGGIGEMVVDGSNGFTFEPGSVNSLSETLQKAMALDEADYHQFSDAALLTSKQFTGEEVSRKMMRFFADLLSGEVDSGQEWVETQAVPRLRRLRL